MAKSLAVVAALLMIGVAAPAGAASDALAEWEKCAARIRKDMPIPPANVGAQDLTIARYCGKKPEK